MEPGKIFQQELLPKYECLLFDVDDTLYPLSSGLSKECAQNIIEYMVQRLGIDEKEAPKMNQVLYKNYGTSMAGLRAAGYDFDYDDYHSFVHGRLSYAKLHHDYHLRTLLLSLPVRKVIFSNGDKAHVAKVIKRLGLEGCFDETICYENLNPPPNTNDTNGSASLPIPIFCKPQEIAFEVAFKKADIDPRKTLFFDDSIRNIQAAKRVGLQTVLVGSPLQSDGVDFTLESIHNLKEALPQLWQLHDFEKSENRNETRRETGMETSVVA
ncbi:uncharacterized protein LOC114734006 [Neltuma alba]|uniref:uncharacterized protein LOC114734006 n=1 Tax=Neltuma alba TaxID=207710 RepID=UPI0010A40886|nr:uncharacterized protein LOC114734006 [Prosopis alba]